MLIDSHAHLTHTSFDEESVRPLLERASKAGIEAIINICTNPAELEKGLKLSQEFPWVYTAASTTPHDVEKEGGEVFHVMEKEALKGDLVAVGETGLDYHYYPETKETQQFFLRRYVRLARQSALPIIIHCREAFNDLFRVLDEDYVGQPGVLHCFTGTVEEAEEVVARGLYLSLSGIVTFKKSTVLHEVAKKVPLDRLLIETDSPYLSPTPYRGKPNEPAFLIETAKFVAGLRGISLAELASATTRNARSLFRI